MSKKVKLFELADKKFINVAKGKNLPKDYRDKGDFPVIAAGKSIAYFSSHANYNTNTITISSSGANAGFVWKHTYPIWASDCTVIEVNENINLDYFYLFLLSKQEIIYSFQTGAGQPHVYWKDIKNIEIDLPSLEKQKQIAKTLYKANELIELRKESITKLDALAKSIFIDMFGDPVSNTKGWEIVKLGKYGKLSRGKSSHRPRNAPFLYGGKYPFIQTGDVARGKSTYITKYTQTYSEEGIKQSKLFLKDTIAITIAANIGDAKILNFDSYFPDSVVGFNVNIPLFVVFLLKFYKYSLEQQATSTAQKNINLQVLNDLDVIHPQIDLQNKFAKIIEKIEEQKSLYEKELELLQNNFDALLQKSFQE